MRDRCETDGARLMVPKAATADASAVLTFWYGDGLDLGWPSASRSDLWFGGGPKLDQQITAQFGPMVQDAVAGGLQTWQDGPTSRLALVILLDQFTRNVYRGSKKAYDGDARAQALVADALAKGMDPQLPWAGRAFMYMPLMHTESIAHQDECVRRFTQLHADVPDALKASIQSVGELMCHDRHMQRVGGTSSYMRSLSPLPFVLMLGSLLHAAETTPPAADPLALPPAGEEADPTTP